jgi:Cysteine-rich secretory protein family
MGTVLLVGAIWFFLLALALGILRTAGRAERDAERRLQERRRESRPRRRPAEAGRRAARIGVVVAALPLAASAGAPDADAASCTIGRGGAPLAPPSATLCLINRERRAHGLVPLSGNARLGRAAGRHAADMVRRGYFSHVSPEGQTFVDRLRDAGYLGRCAWSAGETLAWGSGTESSPRSRVQAWMHSAPHRAVLLGRSYREAGIAVLTGSPGGGTLGSTYVGEFGRRRC